MNRPYGSLEGTGIEQLDARFHRLVPGPEKVERLWTGARWREGPAWFARPSLPGLVRHSQQPHAALRRAQRRRLGVPRAGQQLERQHGRPRRAGWSAASTSRRRVTRTEHDGRITVLADRWQGKRLNSPNDVVVHSDGGIWFTDPSYGILHRLRGRLRAESEIGACHVYRIDPASGAVDAVADDFVKPNGLAFSPDESMLYIADTGASHASRTARATSARSRSTATASARRRRVSSPNARQGIFDGFRLDTDGRIWTSAGDGVHVYAPGRQPARQDPASPSGSPTSASAARSATACSSAPRSSLYAITLNASGSLNPHVQDPRPRSAAGQVAQHRRRRRRSPAEAEQVAANLVEANLRGHDSHGVGMVPRYVDAVLEGGLVSTPRRGARRLRRAAHARRPARLRPGDRRARRWRSASSAPSSTACCVVGLAHSHHLGRIGHWAEQCIAAGLVSIHFVNVLSRPIVAPFGGRDARLRHQSVLRRHSAPGRRADRARLRDQQDRPGQDARRLQQGRADRAGHAHRRPRRADDRPALHGDRAGRRAAALRRAQGLRPGR